MRARPHLWLRTIAGLALAAGLRPAAGEECIKSWHLSVDLPRDGSRVPPDARPRVRIYESCASFTGGPRPEVRLVFPRARQARPHAEILYLLEGRRDGAGDWQIIDDLRPAAGGDRARFEWTQQRGYGERWEYRMRARDLAGREAIGARTVTVRNPPAPPRPKR